MNKQDTKTRTEGKAPSADQGALATQPGAQQTKVDSQELKSAIDPEITSGSRDTLAPIVPEHTSGNDGDSAGLNPGGNTGTVSGEFPEPDAPEHTVDNDSNTTGEQLAPKPVLQVIAMTYEGTAELVRRLWEKFLPEGVPVNIRIAASLEEMLSDIISSPVIPDEFIFVPANCVPVAPVDMADLSQIKVYVRKDGTRSFDERLPVLLNKDQLIESLAAESGPAADDFFEKYVKTHHPGIRPMEVSHDFGNFVTLVMRSNPCENVVIGGMCQHKFIAATAEGWKAIEHLLNKRLE